MINGIFVVMLSSWGKYLGVIDFKFEKMDGLWKVVDFKSSIEFIVGSVIFRNEIVINII